MMSSRELARTECSGSMPELWFGPNEDQYEEEWDQFYWRMKRAKEFCQRCPVQMECLADELTFPERGQHGVRGGLSANERLKLLRIWRQRGLIDSRKQPSQEQALALLISRDQLSA